MMCGIGESLLNSIALNKGVGSTDRRISGMKSKKLVAGNDMIRFAKRSEQTMPPSFIIHHSLNKKAAEAAFLFR